MPVEVILPRVDMDMSSGRISKWHAREGDQVRKGAALFEIETDKAAMEIEAPADGILRNIMVGEGGTAPVGSAVAYIYAMDDAVPAPAARAEALSTETEPSSIHASLPRATPLARRLARHAGLAIGTVAGSGPRGRVVAADVRAASAAAGQTPQSAAAPATAAQAAPADQDVLPLNNMRRTIAQRLTEAKQAVPHFYLSATCTIDRLMAARERLNSTAPAGPEGGPLWKLSLNDFIIKAMGVALKQVPSANVTWAGDSILQHKTSDVGVAVAVEGGLFTPVIRNVESKTLSAISAEMKELAARARARKLAPADYQGGSAAISNLGMYGVEQFTAIINPPQATILAVGAAVERFIPVNGQPVLATQMTCTLSCDHRAIDGAVGAALLQAFRRLIEDPLLMLA